MRKFKWNVGQVECRTPRFSKRVVRNHTLDKYSSAELVKTTMNLIHHACDTIMPHKRKLFVRRKTVYWWAEESAMLRTKCLFLTCKKDLKKAIDNSKHHKWEDLKA